MVTPPESGTHPAAVAVISALVGLLVGVMVGIAMSSPHWPAVGEVPFGDGVHAVGHDLQPGFYRTDGGPDICDWERLSDLTGSDAALLAINTSRGQQTVQVLATDAGFATGGGCEWKRVG